MGRRDGWEGERDGWAGMKGGRMEGGRLIEEGGMGRD